MRIALSLILTTLAVSAVRAEPAHTFSSGIEQTELIELYTSEGCSSCPPADRWFSQLGQAPGLWSDFVPVAFHVTYWNYLGWEDRFSQAKFDQRQRDRANTAGAVVYTPGVFLSGDEYRRWRIFRKAPKANTDVAAGRLTIQVTGSKVEATFSGRESNRPLNLVLALLASNQQTDVQAGENRGRTLAHDFVVTALEQHPLQRGDEAWVGTFSLPQNVKFDPNALAAWVSDADGVPLQATGGWLN